MQINNFVEALEIVSNIVIKHNGERSQLTINGDGKFYRNLQLVNNFQVLSEFTDLLDVLNEINRIFYINEKQLKEIIK